MTDLPTAEYLKSHIGGAKEAVDEGRAHSSDEFLATHGPALATLLEQREKETLVASRDDLGMVHGQVVVYTEAPGQMEETARERDRVTAKGRTISVKPIEQQESKDARIAALEHAMIEDTQRIATLEAALREVDRIAKCADDEAEALADIRDAIAALNAEVKDAAAEAARGERD